MIRYILCLAAVLISALPLICAAAGGGKGREEPEGRSFSLKGLFSRAACLIWKRLPGALLSLPLISGSSSALAMARRLYPGMDMASFRKKVQIRRIRLIYSIFLAAVVVGSGAWILAPHKGIGGSLRREAADGKTRTEDITAVIDGQKEEISLDVAPREYSKEERDQLMAKTKKYIDKELPGKNKSLDDVRYPLVFVSSYPGENVSIEWECDDYNLIDQDGSLGDLNGVKLPARTAVTAIIHYSTYRTEYRKSVRITEYLQTEEESLRGRLLKALKAADQASKGEDYLTLPVSLDGKKISWEYAGDWPAGAGILLFIILIAAVLARENEHLKNELERRSQMLLDAYPVFVHRMVLMLGAGITPLKSWEILLADIEKENRGSENLSYLRREMRYSLLQLRSGVPEVSVYREFGSRTGLACYEQFCQLIVQSIKKGRKGIGDMMMNEAQDAQKRRRDTAKKMGETASTKLLGPMMMMLVAVIAVVMAPALLEM